MRLSIAAPRVMYLLQRSRLFLMTAKSSLADFSTRVPAPHAHLCDRSSTQAFFGLRIWLSDLKEQVMRDANHVKPLLRIDSVGVQQHMDQQVAHQPRHQQAATFPRP